MKYTLFALCAAFLAATCYAGTPLGSTPDSAKLHLTVDDLLFTFTNSKGKYLLSAEQRELTKGKDMIIAGIFTDKSGWYQQIPNDDRSYIGIERMDASSSAYAYSCAGAYKETLKDGYQFVFNRADPESAIKDAVIPNNDQFKYQTKIGDASVFTLQNLYDALKSGHKAAISLLRTPQDNRDDMLAVSILYYNPDGTHYFDDFVVACEVSDVGDDSSVKSVAYDPQRLSGGFYFVDKDEKGFEEDDIIAANHYILAGDIPHPTPEPATATLSLLALAALVSRRRRA